MITSFRHATAIVIALMLASITAQAADLHDMRGTPTIHGNPAAGQTKAAVCMACHGSDGYSVVPEFPNLAGQSTTYLYQQMQAFKQGWRSNAVMQSQLSPLSDTELADLAAFFTAMPTRKASAESTASDGRNLYLEGASNRGIPACQGCHGSDGDGPQSIGNNRIAGVAWSTFPALAGQSSAYVQQQLKAYRGGQRSGSTNAAVMHGVTENLTDTDIAALAHYIAGL
ncbi:MAG TPA: c-type cytochrome [Rhodanobacteraceae bacterium]|nr:c-type cytochrome [Rhodanobacteraceae bacterium]